MLYYFFRDELISNKLIERTRDYVVDEIFMPMKDPDNARNFNLKTTLKLNEWVNNTLPELSIEVARQVLENEFKQLLGQSRGELDVILNDLKLAVFEEAWSKHQWDCKALQTLVSTT